MLKKFFKTAFFVEKWTNFTLPETKFPVFDTKTVKKVPKSQQICGLWDFLKFLTYTLRVLFFRLSKNFSHFIYWDDFF